MMGGRRTTYDIRRTCHRHRPCHAIVMLLCPTAHLSVLTQILTAALITKSFHRVCGILRRWQICNVLVAAVNSRGGGRDNHIAMACGMNRRNRDAGGEDSNGTVRNGMLSWLKQHICVIFRYISTKLGAKVYILLFNRGAWAEHTVPNLGRTQGYHRRSPNLF